VNLDGTFRACQAFVRKLRRAGKPGAIVNISSAAGIMAVPNRLGYVASKFGVSGGVRSNSTPYLNLAGHAHGIRA
jgi:NAD(P)-dependent dehydrogenase (short-subunit alcohol dehydrogenase family)